MADQIRSRMTIPFILFCLIIIAFMTKTFLSRSAIQIVIPQTSSKTDILPINAILTSIKEENVIKFGTSHGVYAVDIAVRVLPALKIIFFQNNFINGSAKRSIFIDIGANIGQTSEKIFQALSLDCNQTKCNNAASKTANLIFSFEPMDLNWIALLERSHAQNWKAVGWIGVKSAVGRANGVVNFYTIGRDGDPQGSMDPGAAYLPENTLPIKVPLITLDTFFTEHCLDVTNSTNSFSCCFPRVASDSTMQACTTGKFDAFGQQHDDSWQIFLLKIDAEGYDMDVLDGAETLLKTSRVRYLSFEYNSKWFTAKRNRTLHNVIDKLYQSYKYACYWITNSSFIPIFDFWWSDVYEFRAWSNVLCAQKEDLIQFPIKGWFDGSELCPYFYCWS